MSTYFHLDRSCRAVASTTFNLTTDLTGFKILSVDGFYNKADAIARINNLYPEGISNHGIQYLLMEDILIYHSATKAPQPITYTTPMIEAVFEMVRMAEFSYRPSRMQSMFGWLSLEHARDYQRQENRGAIFEISADDAFIADQKLLLLGASVAGAYELARKYWSGERSNNEKLEAVIPLPKALGNPL